MSDLAEVLTRMPKAYESLTGAAAMAKWTARTNVFPCIAPPMGGMVAEVVRLTMSGPERRRIQVTWTSTWIGPPWKPGLSRVTARTVEGPGAPKRDSFAAIASFMLLHPRKVR